MKASVIIPAYNEEKGLDSVLQQFEETAKKHKMQIEIIVVDDGSSDATSKIAKKRRSNVIRHPQNVGYGRALQTGIRAAENEYVVICDADGTYPVEEFPELLRFLEDGFDMVVGLRRGHHYRGSLFKSPARLFFKLLSEFVTGTKIPDVNSGFRAFKKSDALEFLKYTCPTFSFTTSLTLIYHLEGKFVKYYPIPYFARRGKSKVRYFRDTLRTGQVLTETIMLYNPIKLFLLLALFFALFAFILLGAYILTKSTFLLIIFISCFLLTVSVICLGFVASIFKKGNR